MATRSRDTSDTAGAAWGGKLIAGMAWAVAVWTTQNFFGVMVPDAGNALIVAFIAQAIFTVAESAIWKNRGRWYNFVILGIDTITNVGGVFVYILQLDKTDSWAAFNSGLGTTGGMNPLAALLISIVVGVLLAATPEFLWRQK
jgi:vacuolar-type H+-ATPase subunit I/STV1